MDIIKSKAKSPFLIPIFISCCVVFVDIILIAFAIPNAFAASPFLIPIFTSCCVVFAMGFYLTWQWWQGHERTQALVERIRAIRAQAGLRPRHLPSWPSRYHLFSESPNWAFRLDRELNALERQRGVRVPYSQRRFSGDHEEVLNSFTRRVEALEGSQC